MPPQDLLVDNEILVTLLLRAQQVLSAMTWYVAFRHWRAELLAFVADPTQIRGHLLIFPDLCSSTGKRLSWVLYVKAYRFVS